MKHLGREAWDDLVILSGDQLYRMDLGAMLQMHRDSSAAVTVAMKAVAAEQTQGLGIMKVDPSGRVLHFDEKPPQERLPNLASTPPGAKAPVYLASMGMYVFGRQAVEQALENAEHIDFGAQVLPGMWSKAHVQGYLYEGYWEDVGTVRSYFEANLALTRKDAAFNFYHPSSPIYSQRPFLAPTQLHACQVHDALIADGCYLDRVNIEHAIIGVRSRIGTDVRIKSSLVLGADEYETAVEVRPGTRDGQPPLGIGDNTSIENAIIDKNARIGKNVRIHNASGLRHHDGASFFVRDGIVIVPKSGIIPDGTVI
jgi:glucose-1-phosphate adenylyltransferase